MKQLKRLSMARAAMTLVLAMLTAATAWANGTLSGNGTSGSPYLINDVADWETFVAFCTADNVNHEGKYFLLNNDITVGGSYVSPHDSKDFNRLIVGNFGGTFDGGGHTLTFNFVNTVCDYTAPFNNIQGATIKNLKVAGAISVGKDFAGSFVGTALGSNTIENCTSSVTINSNRQDSGGHGGFVGRNKGTLSFGNCVFDGQIVGRGYTKSNGGFVGHNNGSASFTDCLFNPASITVSNCHTFCKDYSGTSSYTRAYYTPDYTGYSGFTQGKRIYVEAPGNIFTKKVTAADNHQYWAVCTAEISGLSSVYDLSAGVNLNYEVTIDGETLTSGTDYTTQILDNSGNAVTNITVTGYYTLKVTGTGDYAGSISRRFEVFASDAVLYVDVDAYGNRSEQCHNAERFSDSNTPKGDWWYISGETTINWRIEIKGEKHLILCDGATLNLPKGIQLGSDNTLYIYGQGEGTGKLIINGVETGKAGIGGNYWGACGTLVVNGGDINVRGGNDGGSGIGGGALGHGGTITINGGRVTANGSGSSPNGIGGGSVGYLSEIGGNGGTITINGGIVSANGMGGGYNNNSGTITIALKNATDRVYSGGYRYENITLDGEFVLEDGTAATTDNIGWRTVSHKLTITFDGNGGNGTMPSVVRGHGAEYELPACGFTREGYNFVGWEIDGTQYQSASKVTLEGDITVKAAWEAKDNTVTFDANGYGTAPASQIVKTGSLAYEPEALTASDYVFCGWYTTSNGGTRWDFANTPVEGDMTLYAKWEQHVNTITYDLDGGTNSVNNPLYYNTNSTAIMLSAPTKEGYSFTGWTGSNGEAPQTAVTVTTEEGGKSYTAHWQVNQYTITFDTDGGTAVASITQDYGSVITAPVSPTKKEKIFMYWEGLPYFMPAENITVSARWLNLTKQEAKAATCLEEGCIEHYTYAGTSYYKEVPAGDSYTYKLVDASEVILPKSSHSFGSPQWKWGIDTYDGGIMAILQLKCSTCNHTLSSMTDNLTSEVTTEPGEYTEGVRTYTATQTHYGQTYTDIHTEPIPMTHAVAKIAQKTYSSLKAALDEAKTNEVVLLCEDVSKTDVDYGGDSGYRESLTLDLNGHSVALSSITTMANLTVKNGTLRCIIKNDNADSDNALTLDHAVVHCEEVSKYNTLNELVPYNGLDWLAKNIAVTNGSQLYIVGGTYLGGGSQDGFNLTIDGTSCVVLQEATLSGYNDARVRSQFAQYLPTADYSISNGGKVTYGGSEYTDPVTLSPATITLVDNADNSTAIAFNYGYEKNVQLSGRTLTKDGTWNTLVLPFSLTAAQIAASDLAGATIKELDNSASGSNLDGEGLLTLKFTAATSIEAGKPYIVKWDGASGSVSDPVFSDVTITSTTPTAVKSDDNNVTFVGQYSPFTIDDSNINTVIMLGSGSTLGYSKHTRTLHSCRAHFEVPETVNVREFVLDFGDETTGILSIDHSSLTIDHSSGAWYSLDGRKLDGKPAKKGVYINKGRQVVIK